MKVFIWRRLDNLTDNFHPEGGAVAIAATLERARELLRAGKAQEPVTLSAGPRAGQVYVPEPLKLPAESEVFTVEPDLTVECDPGAAEFVEWFPDAGCC